jgi:hypothetical protein
LVELADVDVLDDIENRGQLPVEHVSSQEVLCIAAVDRGDSAAESSPNEEITDGGFEVKPEAAKIAAQIDHARTLALVCERG